MFKVCEKLKICLNFRASFKHAKCSNMFGTATRMCSKGITTYGWAYDKLRFKEFFGSLGPYMGHMGALQSQFQKIQKRSFGPWDHYND